MRCSPCPVTLGAAASSRPDCSDEVLVGSFLHGDRRCISHLPCALEEQQAFRHMSADVYELVCVYNTRLWGSIKLCAKNLTLGTNCELVLCCGITLPQPLLDIMCTDKHNQQCDKYGT
jgi:hypothetical protein